MSKIIQITGVWPKLVALTEDGKILTMAYTNEGYSNELMHAMGEPEKPLKNEEKYCWVEVNLKTA